MFQGPGPDVVAVPKIASMLAMAAENTPALLPRTAPAGAARFARDPAEYANHVTRPALARSSSQGANQGTALASTGTGGTASQGTDVANAGNAVATTGTTLASVGTGSAANSGTGGTASQGTDVANAGNAVATTGTTLASVGTGSAANSGTAGTVGLGAGHRYGHGGQLHLVFSHAEAPEQAQETQTAQEEAR
ncbi:hypothetical protein [Pseudarthrobacter sp. NIBRBAC000502772]|uniref:hypothetical protein n=1 Tax=Pseudarthrobacter sp. NIBRBAC000502772 TaxID=2590775 RepID=UPI001AEF39F1|nr:hypothetical protein [Pseudarthrobacter sp. NIBRBAC000502772]